MFQIRLNLFVALLVFLLVSSLYSSSEKTLTGEEPNVTVGWKQFGDGVSIDERIQIESVLARPEDFVGRPVAVAGKVVGVCRMMACWMELESDGGNRLRIKVEDGVIVFPSDAFGKRAVAQGMVERLTFSREEYLARARHEAEELGRDFDPQSVTPPYEEILVRGTGALIQGNSDE